MTWAQKRKIFIVGIIALAIVIPVFYFSTKKPAPTCTDKIQNGEEEGIDCGGPACEKCLGEIKDISVGWIKPFLVSKGKYEVGVFIQNPNVFAGLAFLPYTIKLYDEKNVLVAVREGKTFLNTGERTLIFEPNISTGERIADRATIDFGKNLNWKRIEKAKPNLAIVDRSFENIPSPIFSVTVENKELLPVYDVLATAAIFGPNEKVLAVSSTNISSIPSGEARKAVFTWREPFLEETLKQEIFIRVPQLK